MTAALWGATAEAGIAPLLPTGSGPSHGGAGQTDGPVTCRPDPVAGQAFSTIWI
jgi:hypothetical protein